MGSSGKSSSTNVRKIRANLLAWYDVARRDLPWRRTTDPYRIWVSEIMLQQTRVAAVIEYYRRFLDRFPDLPTLATAKEKDVLAAWSGLGYYRRARALHQAAKVVVKEHVGSVPHTAAELVTLPGIGRYTAAAISSIAFGEKQAVVDGNVERVLSRLLGKHLRDREDAWSHAEALLDPDRPGDWNQAMMELGAMVCLPADPKCLICPIRKWCKEPGREVRKAQGPRKQKELLFGLAQRRDSIYLVQRPNGASLMADMWELPSVEDHGGSLVLHRARHSITDSDYKVTIFFLDEMKARGGKWIRRRQLHALPVTGLTRKVLRAANLWPES